MTYITKDKTKKLSNVVTKSRNAGTKVRYYVLYLIRDVSKFEAEASGVRRQESGIRNQKSEIRNQESGIR